MTRSLAALVLAAALAVPAAAEPHLVLRLIADEQVIAPGDSVNWQIWAELFEPEQNIFATVAALDFSLTFGGHPSLSIVANEFAPAFDSPLLGPADDGTVVGDSITGASGFQALPPLTNPGGPDSSNPLFIYSFIMVHNGDGGGEMYSPIMSISLMTGAYDAPFPIPFDYTDAGGPGVPFTIIADTVYNVPAPATALALLGLIATRRRSR